MVKAHACRSKAVSVRETVNILRSETPERVECSAEVGREIQSYSQEITATGARAREISELIAETTVSVIKGTLASELAALSVSASIRVQEMLVEKGLPVMSRLDAASLALVSLLDESRRQSHELKSETETALQDTKRGLRQCIDESNESLATSRELLRGAHEIHETMVREASSRIAALLASERALSAEIAPLAQRVRSASIRASLASWLAIALLVATVFWMRVGGGEAALLPKAQPRGVESSPPRLHSLPARKTSRP